MRESHSIGIRPLPDSLKVPADMLRLKVWPVTLDPIIRKLGEVMECEDPYVTLAHEVESESLDAVVDVAAQILLSISLSNVTAHFFLAVVVFVDRLSEQVEAVQLVEDLDAGSVTPLACHGMLDLQRFRGEA